MNSKVVGEKTMADNEIKSKVFGACVCVTVLVATAALGFRELQRVEVNEPGAQRLSMPVVGIAVPDVPESELLKGAVCLDATHSLAAHVSILLSHGRGQDALKLLCKLDINRQNLDWSEGRICWYKSLACRLSGDQAAAAFWQNQALEAGMPELGEGMFSFWEQQQHWSSDLSAEIAGLDVSEDGLHYVSLVSKADSVAYTAQQMVGEIRKESRLTTQGPETSERIISSVKLATWQLLLGEYTSFHESLALWTTSVDSFVNGKQLLQEIESEIELNPDLENVISSVPEVAIRLDSARVRLVAIENKEAMSRQEEVARLHQLREVAKQYRSMTDSMLKWQSYFTLDDVTKSNESAVQAMKFLQDVQVTVEQRSGDFHLFDDESPIDGDSEFEILAIKPAPLSSEPLAHLKATRAYGLYLAALDENDGQKTSELLDEAEKWASAALDDQDNIAEMPKGADQNNLIGKLTLGMVHLEKGHAISLSPEANLRADADKNYQTARLQLKALEALLGELGYADTDSIPAAITRSLDLLSGLEASRDKSIRLFLEGELERARDELLLATKVHREGTTALESLLIGIHAGLSTEDLRTEWRQYQSAGIFSDGNVEAMLAKARISCLAAGRALAGEAGTGAVDLLGELKDDSDLLRNAANDRQISDELRNAVKANLALAQAYRGLLQGKSDGNLAALGEEEIKEAYRHGRDAEFHFQKRIGTEVNEISSFSDLRARDALVASRLALGHLAAMHLDEWRDESRIFLAAAVQEAAKLPRVDPLLPLLGEPLLKQFFSDASNRDQKLAAEERQRRQMVTRCLEALFVLRFGSPSAGATQMTKAVALGEVSADLERDVNAAELSAAADGFDAKISLPDTVKAFEVLSLLEAEQSKFAFEKAVALASSGAVLVTDFENKSLEKANALLEMIESPLVAFVFAAAIEARLSAWPVSEDLDGRVWFSERAMETLNRGRTMLDEMRLANRYPHIQTVILDRISKFADANSFIDDVKSEIDLGRYENAKEKSLDGLSKHAKSPSLWDLYLRSSILISARGSRVEESQLAGLLSEINAAQAQRLITDYSAFELSAKVLEELGRDAEAAENYSRAADATESDVNRIRASANAERLRVGIMASAN